MVSKGRREGGREGWGDDDDDDDARPSSSGGTGGLVWQVLRPVDVEGGKGGEGEYNSIRGAARQRRRREEVNDLFLAYSTHSATLTNTHARTHTHTHTHAHTHIMHRHGVSVENATLFSPARAPALA